MKSEKDTIFSLFWHEHNLHQALMNKHIKKKNQHNKVLLESHLYITCANFCNFYLQPD